MTTDAIEATTAGKLEFSDFSMETLMGDLRDAMLDRLKAMPKPWTVMSQNEQGEMIMGVTMAAHTMITKAIRLVASNGFPAVSGKMVKCAIKDVMQIQIDVSRHDTQRLTLIDSVGQPVIIVVPEPDLFMGERAPAKPDPKPDVNPAPVEGDLEGVNPVLPFKAREPEPA